MNNTQFQLKSDTFFLYVTCMSNSFHELEGIPVGNCSYEVLLIGILQFRLF